MKELKIEYNKPYITLIQNGNYIDITYEQILEIKYIAFQKRLIEDIAEEIKSDPRGIIPRLK